MAINWIVNAGILPDSINEKGVLCKLNWVDYLSKVFKNLLQILIKKDKS